MNEKIEAALTEVEAAEVQLREAAKRLNTAVAQLLAMVEIEKVRQQ